MAAPYSLYWGDSVYAKVKATNIVGDSAESLEGNGGVLLTNPDAPVSLANDVATTSSTTIGLTWSAGAEDGGTRYRVDTVIGSDLPVLGPVINWYLRTQVFHPRMLAEWQRHQVEEVSSLQFFLPALYAQRGIQGEYVLN